MALAVWVQVPFLTIKKSRNSSVGKNDEFITHRSWVRIPLPAEVYSLMVKCAAHDGYDVGSNPTRHKN